jgi:hypothetical protein
MTNIELFYFLGKCLALGEDGEKSPEVILTIREEAVNWELFVSMASGHLVLPSVYLRFKRYGIISDLPGELNDHLKMIYELNYQRNTAILAQISRINRLFATAGIVPVYLKGAGNLLDHLYEDAGERMLGDIDLLVSDAEFFQAVKLLKDEGYEQPCPFFEDEKATTKHFPRLAHPKEPADVEIHRVPVELSLSAHFNYEIIRPKVKLIETSPPCYVLYDQHKVILNFMHGFMAGDVRLMRSISFRNMTDLFLLSNRVDVFEVLAGQPQYASKALIYADFVNHAIGFTSTHQPALRSKFFIWKHGLLLKSKFCFRTVWLSTFLLNRIWSAYLKNAAGIFFSKQIRRSVFRRLRTPNWFKEHLKTYTDSFRQNFGKG